MLPKMKELLGRVAARHSGDAHVWQAYARLYGDGHGSNPEDNEKVSILSRILTYFMTSIFVDKEQIKIFVMGMQPHIIHDVSAWSKSSDGICLYTMV